MPGDLAQMSIKGDTIMDGNLEFLSKGFPIFLCVVNRQLPAKI